MTATDPPTRTTGISRSFLIVGAGLATIGIGSLAFLAIASRALDEDAFAAFGVWFGLVNVVSFGLFVPLETAIARALLTGAGFVGKMRSETIRYTCAVLGGVLIVAVVFQSIVLPRLMGDSWPLVALTMAYLSMLALQAIQRGVAVGHDRFWPLFWQFGVDGALRLAIPALVAASGRGTPEMFALSVVVSAGCGLLAGQLALASARDPSSVKGGPSSTGLDGRAVAALVIAAIGAQLLANGAPPILSLIGRDTAAVLAGVVGALALTRLPLLFASAIQAPLLPPMVRLIRSGDTSLLWRLLGRILAGFGALGVVGFLLGWFLGTELLRIYLGDDYGARPISMAILTSAGVGLLAIVAVQAAVVAVGSNLALAVSWGLGITAFFTVTAFPVDGLVLAPAAVAIGTAVTLLALLVGLRSATR